PHTICYFSFFFHDPPPTDIYTLSLHDALPISRDSFGKWKWRPRASFDNLRSYPADKNAVLRSAIAISRMRYFCTLPVTVIGKVRSEEHTSELQSQSNLVCRLLLEKKKKK